MSTPIDNYNPNLEEEDAQIELCDYVFQIADYREDGEFHPYRFWYRYCTGAIDYPFTKERFLKMTILSPRSKDSDWMSKNSG